MRWSVLAKSLAKISLGRSRERETETKKKVSKMEK